MFFRFFYVFIYFARNKKKKIQSFIKVKIILAKFAFGSSLLFDTLKIFTLDFK
jgi:hypothetical protein